MARGTRLCHVCGEVFATPADRNAHLAAAHPGTEVRWRGDKGRSLVIVSPDGTETPVTKHRLAVMRAKVRADDAVPSPPPAADDDPTPLPEPDPGPRLREPRRPERAPRMAQGPAPATPSRSSLAEAMPPATLAAIIRQVSVSISSMDGAGPAGELSATEAATIASLVHDAALDAILRYFGGSVDRFKVAMAVVIIVLAKGRVHAQALARGRRERAIGRAAIEAEDYTAAQAEAAAADTALGWTVPIEGPPIEASPNGNGHAPEPEPPPYVDPIAALAARQRASRLNPEGAA